MTVNRTGTSAFRRGWRGFTLIELMVTVAIIAILAAIAYPSYRQYVLKSRRSDAKVALLQAAALEEKYFTQCNTYTAAFNGAINVCGAGGGLGMTTAAAGYITQDGYYSLAITQLNGQPLATSYLIIATPTTTGGQNADVCNNFTLDSTGLKGASGPAECLPW